MKLLFVLPRTPWPPYAGQARLAFNRARELRKQGFEVSLFAYGKFIPVNSSYSNLESSKAFDTINLYSFGTIEHFLTFLHALYYWFFLKLPLVSLVYTPAAVINRFRLLLASNHFDIIHFYSINSYPLWSIASSFNLPFLVDLVDSMSLNLQCRASTVPRFARFLFDRELICIKSFETCLPVDPGCSAFLSVSEKDLGYFSVSNTLPAASAPALLVHNIGVEIFDYSPPRIEASKPLEILFFGSLYYHPNIEAVLWFVHNVCPLLLEAVDFSFSVAGSMPDPALVRLSTELDYFNLIANPCDMNSLINNSFVTVAPMKSGSGQQFKVLESLACSTPVVASSLAANPLGLVNGKHLLIADTPFSFAQSILSLASDSSLLESITRSGWDYVSRMYSWGVKAERLADLYSAILSTK